MLRHVIPSLLFVLYQSRFPVDYRDMKIISWNVNGIRSVANKGLLNWLSEESPDILCVQEIKAEQAVLDPILITPYEYNSYWFSAQKKGYSGVAIYSKEKPIDVSYGIGDARFDSEGRTITAEFKKIIVINSYFPNSQRDHARLGYKIEYCDKFLQYVEKLRKSGKGLVMCGDYNIAHKEIDLKNPKTNMNNAGFLPEERSWMDKFVASGYVDTFREFCKEGNQYTWWSYRPGVREKNIGWRLDYHFVNSEFMPKVKNSYIQCETMGSDHCPVVIELGI